MAQIFYDKSVKSKGLRPKLLLAVTSGFARLSPSLSARFALKYLFKPYSRREYDFRTQTLPTGSHEVKTLKGGVILHQFTVSKEGDHVLLSHGWADTSVRFTYLIDHLLEQGFNVWAFDQIGHGRSHGDTAHLFGFVDGLEKSLGFIEKEKNSKVVSIIGHSMGALAVLNQDHEHLKNKKIIMMSAPTKFFENLFINTKKFGVSNKMILNALNHVAKLYKTDWKEFSPNLHTHKIDSNFLMIHDEKDAVCSYENFKDLVEGTKHEFLTTQGLGHLKILKDAEVINKISSFIQGQ